VRLVVIGVDQQQVAAFRRQRLRPVADLDREARVVGRQREVRARRADDARIAPPRERRFF